MPSPVDLLRVLGSAIRPDGAAQLRDAGVAEAFEKLLEKAQAGSLETGLPVSVASGADVELSELQLGELSRLVDRAHADGATRIAVLVEGKALDVDVLSRRVLGELDLSNGRVMTGIDGIVQLGTNADSLLGVLPTPSPGTMDPSLLKLLGQDTHNTARA